MSISVPFFSVRYLAITGAQALGSSLVASLLWCIPAVAQPGSNEAAIIPDASLGAEGSRLRSASDSGSQPELLIEGGAQRGANLFHSFDRFSVREDTTVRFVVPLADSASGAVDRIFARVSGGRATEILGILGTTAVADLFLINPNGILFGPNASLDVRGSFIASTAERILFENGFAFDAAAPQGLPLLAVNVPIGLQLGQDPAPIEIRDVGNQVVGDPIDPPLDPPVVVASILGPLQRPDEIEGALQVPEGQTLALVGGPVTLNGGLVVAESGRVILGGAGPNEQVNLLTRPEGWKLDFGSVSQFEDIEIGARSLVDASGTFNGAIGLFGKNITLDDQSLILISQETFSNASTSIGVEVMATDLLRADVSLINVQTLVENTGEGTTATTNPSTITVTAGDVSFNDGGGIVAHSFSALDSASIAVNVDNTIAMQGLFPTQNPVLALSSRIATIAFSSGNGGNVQVNANDIQLVRASSLGSIALAPFDVPSESVEGDAGDVTIQVRNSIEIDGIFPGTAFGAAQIFASSFTAGSGGMLTVETGSLALRNGGLISASSFSEGMAGDTFVVAREGIEITGNGFGSTAPGDPLVPVPSAIQAGLETLFLAFGAEEPIIPVNPTGTSGSLTVVTPSLSLDLGAALTVGNEGLNDSGTLDIFANQVFVGTGAQVTASTLDGQGGTIAIRPLAQIPESLLDSLAEPEGFQQALTAPTATQLTLDGPSTAITAQAIPVDTGEFLTAGNAGGVMIALDEIAVRDGASINVSSPLGEAGTLTIEADTLELDGGSITALAGSSGPDGTSVGNIELNLEDNLFLRNESSISAEALSEAYGGNVNISTQFVVATPPSGPNGSDIIASAELGNGGSVTIQTEGLLGLDLRDENTALNDILVTSELGIDGELIVESPEIDPQSSLVVLPENLVDSTNLIATGCAADSADFALVGRGGLPADPTAPLQARSLWQDLREPEATTASEKDRPQQPQQADTPDTFQRLVEARGWSIDGSGRVVLLASAEDLPLQHPRCQQL